MSTDKKTIDWYNRKARDYALHVRNPSQSVFHAYYEKPAMYNLLPNLKHKRVLVLGCGTGEDAIYLEKQGAATVTGVDIAEKMIAIAQSSYNSCEFKVMDMENLDFDDRSFDFVYSSLALSYLKNWMRVMTEVSRVLTSGSQFIFSCEHPVSSAMDMTESTETNSIRMIKVGRDRSSQTAEIVGDYLNTHMSPAEIGFDVTTWHRSIGSMSADISAAGLAIERIVEPIPLEDMQNLNNAAYQSLLKFPEFIIFQLHKT